MRTWCLGWGDEDVNESWGDVIELVLGMEVLSEISSSINGEDVFLLGCWLSPCNGEDVPCTPGALREREVGVSLS